MEAGKLALSARKPVSGGEKSCYTSQKQPDSLFRALQFN
jgi:hypothetical protein